MTEASEEATEPLSQPVFEGGERGFGLDEPVTPLDDSPVSLDALVLEDHHHRQGIRILVRPLTKLPGVNPGGDHCQWLALRAEVASSDQPQHKVLAVTHTAKNINFSLRIPGISSRPPLWCDLYFDPGSEKLILLNKSDIPLELELANGLHHRQQHHQLATPPPPDHVVNPGLAQALIPGTWRIKVRHVAVLDFRILEKRPVTLYQLVDDAPSDSASTSSSSGKRSLTMDDDFGSRAKRRISDGGDDGDDDNGVIMFLGPSVEPLVFPLPKSRELSAVNSHALLDANEGETVSVPGVCEVDTYQLTKGDPIASTALSAVYKAKYSKVPDSIVTVKVLKTVASANSDKPLAHERNVIRQADVWLRESQSQDDLKHDSIVRYYGGDARFLSLYMEHVEAPDLASGRWRNKTDEFTGTYDDALRILTDMSRALGYIHDRQLVHNDIKPANILYSPHRGAVLCDFGLLNSAANAAHSGGTPYFIPPEFIGTKLRGYPSDVWALGVTMLYVLRRIPLPDSRARRNHPKRLYWMINGVNNPSLVHREGNGQPAAKQMRDWLTEIFDAREKLNARDRLQRIVKEMLVPSPNQRITMARVLQELQSEQTVVLR
ncbi:hypothetical protein L249_0480 [Ophiocordyceps polyrhachis-furcata BCC 54312]|uniref:Protein kinase domain-containing protein n=1 Tax=Ophiocordyceps polyrhachis-furcata BCC 54312 TaxID=1330021 RepID=A0A367LEX2_9HYPO|nr:hypothetical protein L249_0480 [Ophiocordyceps polyrhachis-furcata BCC 54312]